VNQSRSRGVLIGAGYFARFHAEAWRRIPEAEIVAVVDAAPGRAEAFAGEFGIPRWCESVEHVLDTERPDFVDIVTRPEQHLELTTLAAQHGVHVICQKPMAPSIADCRAMVTACEDAGVRLLIHENWRWQPWYREIKRLLDDDALGRLFFLSFRLRTGDGRGANPYSVQPYFREMPRLLIYETLVHFLDTFRFLAGEMTTVYCRTARINPFIRGEDQAIVQVVFASGSEGLLDANRISGPTPTATTMGEGRVEGDRAMIRLSPDGRLWLTVYGEAEREHAFPTSTAGYKGDSVRATQAHLVECLRSGQPSESEGRDYLKTVEAVFACYQSAETGAAVALVD
jgi:predicted dehydrogenase